MPFTVAVPCLGAPATTIPVMAEPVMKGAKSMVVDVFSGTIILKAPATGASVVTVSVTVAGADVPPGPMATYAKLSVPKNPGFGV